MNVPSSIQKFLPRALLRCEQVLRDGGCVMVHCIGGRYRTAAFCAAVKVLAVKLEAMVAAAVPCWQSTPTYYLLIATYYLLPTSLPTELRIYLTT